MALILLLPIIAVYQLTILVNIIPLKLKCTSTGTMNAFISAAQMEMFISDSSMRANIVGGVLGFIIVVLVLLLVICGGALVYLLQSKNVIPKR